MFTKKIMIEKKDWESALKQYEALQINSMVNAEAQKYMVEFCKKKIAEFPEEKEDDKIKKEVADMLK